VGFEHFVSESSSRWRELGISDECIEFIADGDPALPWNERFA